MLQVHELILNTTCISVLEELDKMKLKFKKKTPEKFQREGRREGKEKPVEKEIYFQG